ncbi:mRNA-degrading endonuclease [Candidatus Poribacteria bacterium]|nr:MAG: mRNA-degrading endonuclease [Candidatus Poribacteria bacterium]
MAYVPWRGDVVWIDLEPQKGREQAGHRPAVVLSRRDYNRKTGLAVICPITTKVKGYPFEVPIPPDLVVTGVILADQIRCVAWRERNTTFICQIPVATLEEVWQKIELLLEIPKEP